MTLNAVFQVGGVPCLISDYLATSDGPGRIEIPTYPDIDKLLPTGTFNVTELVRKSALVPPALLLAGSGNGMSVRRAIARLQAVFDGKPATRADLKDALSQIDDFTASDLTCVLVGWLLDCQKPVSFRWNSAEFNKIRFGNVFIEGSGKRLYEKVAPSPAGITIASDRVFDGAAEFCIHQTATLWVNELLGGHTLSARFGAGYDIFVFSDGHFQLVADVTYLLYKLQFLKAANNSVDYRIWGNPAFTKQFYIDDHCLIRVLMPRNMLGIAPSETERMGIIPAFEDPDS
jgi:hypothetical protein